MSFYSLIIYFATSAGTHTVAAHQVKSPQPFLGWLLALKLEIQTDGCSSEFLTFSWVFFSGHDSDVQLVCCMG